MIFQTASKYAQLMFTIKINPFSLKCHSGIYPLMIPVYKSHYSGRKRESLTKFLQVPVPIIFHFNPFSEICGYFHKMSYLVKNTPYNFGVRVKTKETELNHSSNFRDYTFDLNTRFSKN